MFEMIRTRLRKGRINRRVKSIKKLIKKGELKKAEDIYVRALGDYKEFCKTASYFEKLTAYHNVLHAYNLLAEKGDREEKPVIAVEKAIHGKKAARADIKEKKAEKAVKAEEKTEMPKPEKEAHEAEGHEKHAEEKAAVEKTVHAAQKPLEKQLTTLIDELYSFVQEKGSTTITDASIKFKVSRDRIEEWAKILEEHNLIRLYYPAFTSPQLMSTGWVEKQEEKKRKAAEEKKKKRDAKKKARKK